MKTLVKDVMTRHPWMIGHEDTLKDAARLMRDHRCGEGKMPGRATVGEWMTDRIVSCREADTQTEASRVMRINDVNRLMVREAGGRICGIRSFGSILRRDADSVELAKVVALAAGRKAA